MKIPGYIEWLRSKSTGQEFPHFVASADVDFVTGGLCSATSIQESFIAIGQANDAEYRLGPKDGGLLFAKRANSSLSRDDLRAVFLEEVIDNNGDLKGSSVQEFRKEFKNPTLLYSDPFDPNGRAEPVRRQSVEEFISEGGNVEVFEI